MTDFDVREIQAFLEKKHSENATENLLLKGLAGSAIYFPIASLVKKAPGRIHVLILENSTEASYASADLSVLLGYQCVYLFPASYRGTGKTARPDESFQVQRTMALGAVAEFYRKPSDILLVTGYPERPDNIAPGDQRNTFSGTIRKNRLCQRTGTICCQGEYSGRFFLCRKPALQDQFFWGPGRKHQDI